MADAAAVHALCERFTSDLCQALELEADSLTALEMHIRAAQPLDIGAEYLMPATRSGVRYEVVRRRFVISDEVAERDVMIAEVLR